MVAHQSENAYTVPMKRQRIHNFSVIFEPEAEGGYSVSVPELPGCFTHGKTFEEAKKKAKEAILVYLESVGSRKEITFSSEPTIVSSIAIDMDAVAA
jgi:antitoxin HicB